jgi:hypothetical protein
MSFSDIEKIVAAHHADIVQTIRCDLPYQLPKTHPRWELLSAIAACMCITDLTQAPDQGTALHTGLWQIWYRDRYPIYCLSNELLRQFQQTDAADLAKIVPSDWIPPVALFLLLLPNNAVKSPSGQWVPYILVSLHHPEIRAVTTSEHPRQISIALSDNSEVVWVSGSGLGDGTILHSRNELGSSKADQIEIDWLRDLLGIAFQSAMTLTYLPDLVEIPPIAPKGRNPAGRHKTPLQPRWIGREFKRSSNPTGSNSHASPSTHWRRGHWRQQPCGEKMQQRKLVWIRPTLINSSESPHP